MSSQRIAINESINGENLLGAMMGDGATTLYRRGDEYADIFPVWDWNKVPGTTVEQVPPSRDELKVKGKTSFVGGVSDGTFGMCAMDLARGKLAARASLAAFVLDTACLDPPRFLRSVALRSSLERSFQAASGR